MSLSLSLLLHIFKVGTHYYTQGEKSDNMVSITYLVSQPHQPLRSRFLISDIEHPCPLFCPIEPGKLPIGPPAWGWLNLSALPPLVCTSRRVSHRDSIGADGPKTERVRYSSCRARDSCITVAQPLTKRKPQHDEHELLPPLTQEGLRSARAGTEISG